MIESGSAASRSNLDAAIELARETISQFRLSDAQPLFGLIESQAKKRELTLAVFGRFKAGKSSFLNQVIGRELLPVGVVPVTSVITQISFGADEAASVILQNGGGVQSITPAEISAYVSEAENARNCKGVELVRVTLPELERFPHVMLVDTPGLESTFSENTKTSISWSPNVDLALVVVAVDPPLTEQDIALIERLQRFTPNIAVLLSKVDTLDAPEQREVLTFVENQLAAKFPGGLRVFPFSIRPGYEELREGFEREYLSAAATNYEIRRTEALARKLRTLLRAIGDYLQLSLKSSQTRESDVERFRTRVVDAQSSIGDLKLQLDLLAKHAIATTRPLIKRRIESNSLRRVQERLGEGFSREFPRWRGGFAKILSQFENWLSAQLECEMAQISAAECDVFQEPLFDARRQLRQNLQAFREQLSEQALRTFGVPLRTTEVEIEIQPPRAPDVSVGKIFDHNWELVSPLIPVALIRRAIERRFREKIVDEVAKNFSRLTSQWEEALTVAIRATEKEAERRLDELVLTLRASLCQAERPADSSIPNYLEKISSAIAGLAIPTPDSK